MAGALVQVIPTRTFNFGGMNNPSDLELVLKSGIDATDWLTASLVVKVQPGSAIGSGNKVTVGARLEGPTPEDPGVDFIAPTLLGTVVLDVNSPLPPYCVVSPFGVPLGSTIRVVIQGHVVLAGSLTTMLSVDVCLRNG